jgi:hypothetical protein
MKIERKPFVEKLLALKPALGTSSSRIAELKHIWFGGEEAWTFNGNLGIRLSLKSEFKGGVLGLPLLGLLQGADADYIDVEAVKGTLTVKFGRSRAALPILDLGSSPWNFPVEPTKEAQPVQLDETLIKAFERVGIVRISKPTRVEHWGIVLFPGPDEMTLLYTTDSRAIVELAVDRPLPEKVEKTVLPFDFSDVVVASYDKEASCNTLYIAENYLMFRIGSMLVCSNVLDSSSVDDLLARVDSLVAKVTSSREIPKGFGDALSRVSLLAGDGDAVVCLESAEKSLTVTGRNLQYGEFEEKFPLKNGGDCSDPKIAVNAGLLGMGVAVSRNFAVTDGALILGDGEGFTFMLGVLD